METKHNLKVLDFDKQNKKLHISYSMLAHLDGIHNINFIS